MLPSTAVASNGNVTLIILSHWSGYFRFFYDYEKDSRVGSGLKHISFLLTSLGTWERQTSDRAR